LKYNLYDFYIGSQYWYYTDNAAGDVSYNGHNYIAIGIDRTEVIYNNPTEDLQITVPFGTQPISQNIIKANDKAINVTVYESDGVDTDIIYKGEIVLSLYDNRKRIKSRIKSIETSLRSTIPQKVFSPNCTHNLYDKNCGLSENTYKITITGAAAFSRLSYGDNFYSSTDLNILEGWGDYRDFSYGVLRINDGEETLQITKQTNAGSLTTVYTSTPRVTEIDASSKLEFIIGCDHTKDTCYNINNIERFGGFPTIPQNDPYYDLPGG